MDPFETLRQLVDCWKVEFQDDEFADELLAAYTGWRKLNGLSPVMTLDGDTLFEMLKALRKPHAAKQ